MTHNRPAILKQCGYHFDHKDADKVYWKVSKDGSWFKLSQALVARGYTKVGETVLSKAEPKAVTVTHEDKFAVVAPAVV